MITGNWRKVVIHLTKEKSCRSSKVYTDKFISIHYGYGSNNRVTKVMTINKKRMHTIKSDSTIFLLSGEAETVKEMFTDGIVKVFKILSNKSKSSNYIISIL